MGLTNKIKMANLRKLLLVFVIACLAVPIFVSAQLPRPSGQGDGPIYTFDYSLINGFLVILIAMVILTIYFAYRSGKNRIKIILLGIGICFAFIVGFIWLEVSFLNGPDYFVIMKYLPQSIRSFIIDYFPSNSNQF